MKWILLMLSVLVLFLGCGRSTPANADIVVRCESVTSNTPSGFTVRFRPIDVIKGEVKAGMLDSDGLLDLGVEFRNDVVVPKYYRLSLRKTQERTGIYKNAPLKLLYNYTLINDGND